MSERYSKLFSLPENLYTEGSPVIIAAGALLKDNSTGKLLVQLKFRNISDCVINAVKVKINAFDPAETVLKACRIILHILIYLLGKMVSSVRK